MYNEQKAISALTREKSKCHKYKYKKMLKEYTGTKVGHPVNEKRKLREIVRKRETVSLYPYFHP